ncbi:hypothetical protein ABE522_05270 [Stenotrophomonas pennii]|uniref:hypothetical protein n=1 Tax=Stenotrophomonas lacuserhaii TaxID=2760084 RepID=UPI00320B56BC
MTAISASPVRYTSFISLQLEAKAPVKAVLPAIRAVSNPTRDELPSSLNRTPAAAPHGPGPVFPAAGSSPNAAASASDWKDYVGRLQQQDAVPGARHADPDQGVVTPSNISVKQMVAYLRKQPSATPAGVAQVVRPPMPAPAAAVAVQVAAVTAPATVPSASVLQADDPVPADEAWSRTVPVNQMEHPRRAAEAEAALIDAQLLEEERALDEELGALADAQRPRGGELPMIHEEDDEDPFHGSELFGTTSRWEQAKLRSEAMLRGNAALEEEDAEPVLRSPGRRGNVRFDQVETSRVLEVDAESGESVSVTDAFFLIKEHDGRWKPNQSKQSISPDQISDNAGTRPRVAAFGPPRALTAADDSDFVVQSAFHENRHGQPNHAEIGESSWSDLGRDDELVAPPVGQAFLQLQRIQQMQREVERMQREVETLRRNQQMSEEVGVYF